MKGRLLPLAFGTFMVAMSGCSSGPDSPPNILLIVADDLGYTDLGVYGGEIHTPNIDALAAEGLLFTEFHAGPACQVTRAMLLSGNNHHVAGMRGEVAHLSDRVVPLPRVLRDAGYRTYMTGKWHLGTAPDRNPGAAGFERYFVLAPGAGSHFNSFSWGGTRSRYLEDGEDAPYPDGAYSTELYTDRLIDLIERGRNEDRSFFAFAAYTSPHWPLQVPDEYRDLYSGRYDEGYDVLRAARFQSAVRLGLVPADAARPDLDDRVPAWSELTVDERRLQAREMELYAAMVENLDHHVGRLIDYLKSSGQYENTLIVFMSDNGFNARDGFRTEETAEYFDTTFDNSLENLGSATSWIAPGREWAEAGTAPFSRYKQYVRQGGLMAPLIMTGPPVGRDSALVHGYLTVMDLAPTFVELGRGAYPTDGSVMPMRGESMMPLFRGEADRVHGDDHVTVMFHGGRAFVRQGDWKLVTLEGPFDEAKFALFDLSTDPGETTDLRSEHPERFQELLELWRRERQAVGISLPGDPR